MKIQRLLCMGIAVVSAFVCALSVSAATEDGFTYEVTGDTATITAISDAANVSIPATLGGNNVTAIAPGAGSGLEELETLSFEDATYLTTIGANSFSHCPALTEVTFGTNITAIKDNAFFMCTALTEVELASVETIGNMAFSGCSALTSVTYGESLTSIGFSSFANCTSLETFECTANTANLTEVGECAFWNDSNLGVLETGELTNIRIGAFWNCFSKNSGVSYYRISNNVETIAQGGYGNINFAYVTIPETIDALASTAFGKGGDTIFVVPMNSDADKYFESSNYEKINYGDIDTDGAISSADIRATATYVAKSVADVQNTDNGKAIIADINGDGKITTLDLFKILQSLKQA